MAPVGVPRRRKLTGARPQKPHQPPPPPPGPGGEDQRQPDGAKDAATRVRDNQRASRARRRELLESLQRRVAEYERQGAQATLEMQQAARAVALQNRRLRDLLAAYGVPQAEVDEYARTGVSRNLPSEGVLHTPPPEQPLRVRRQIEQQLLSPTRQQRSPTVMLAPATPSNEGVGSPPNRESQTKKTCEPQRTPPVRQTLRPAPPGETKKACKPQPTPVSQLAPPPSCGSGASSTCSGGGKKNACEPPTLAATALPATSNAPTPAVPSCGSGKRPQHGEAKQRTCVPLTPFPPDFPARGSIGTSDVAIPPWIGRTSDVADVPAVAQSGGTKRKLEEACPVDRGVDYTQQSGGSDRKRQNCEQPPVSPAGTIKIWSPKLESPEVPLDQVPEGEPATVPGSACCGSKICGVPGPIEAESTDPAPPLPLKAASYCSPLPSEGTSCSSAETDVPLQARSVIETACEDAAALLMETRGDNADETDQLEIRNALGCVGPDTCQVKYTTVLQLLDEFTI